jgi:hypothetical protein
VKGEQEARVGALLRRRRVCRCMYVPVRAEGIVYRGDEAKRSKKTHVHVSCLEFYSLLKW